MSKPISFACVGLHVQVRCAETPVTEALSLNFEAMLSDAVAADLVYEVHREAGTSLRIVRVGSRFEAPARDVGEVIYLLESDLVVQAQLRRRDLLFLHAAVLSHEGRAYLFPGRSGAGKSTTCWGLLQHGFGYLSDELAPVVMASAGVLPYPHGICMKREPPAGYALPDTALRTSRGFHVVPLPAIGHATEDPVPLGGIFLLEYDADAPEPSLSPVSTGEAAARLYPNILNALAHRKDGLEAAAALAAMAPAFRLESAELAQTCRAVVGCVETLER